MAATPTPRGAVVTAAYEMHIANGNGDIDSASISRMIKPTVS